MIEFEISTNKKQIDFDITQGIPKYTPANFQSKTVIPTTEQQIIRADMPYDGLEQVTVEPIKVLDKTITQNGAYSANEENIDGYSSVFVNVQPTLQEKSITITENGTTEVVADHGYDGLAKVSVEVNVKGGGGDDLMEVIRLLTASNASYNGNPDYYGTLTVTADMFRSTTTAIEKYKFAYNQAIIRINLPNWITWIEGNAFYFSNRLKYLHMPGVKNIRSYAFNDMKNCIFDFRGATQIPTLQASNSFYNCGYETIIVPDELYDSWIVATNWTTKASKIIKASEYTEA